MIANNYTYLAAISIISVIILFLIYYLLIRYDIILNLFRSKENHCSLNPLVSFFSGKVTGFVLFGVFPYLVFIGLAGMLRSETGLTVMNSYRYWYFLPVSLVIVISLAYRISKRDSGRAGYQGLAVYPRSAKSVIVIIFSWTLYLLGYEFLFRGILWFICYKAFGFWPALLINISLYSLAHLNQGVLMTLGAIPVGIIFCLFSFLTGSILLAFLVHCCMAISNGLFSLYKNPEFKIAPKNQESVK
jgi:membrane protease YdiL (CAAX protease family)